MRIISKVITLTTVNSLLTFVNVRVNILPSQESVLLKFENNSKDKRRKLYEKAAPCARGKGEPSGAFI
jgi:hypothetical protein